MKDQSWHDRLVGWRIPVIAILVLIYITSFLFLSRRGLAIARSSGSEGYYFTAPTDHRSDQFEMVIQFFFAPCVLVDVMIFGSSSPSSSAPLRSLS